MKLVIAGWKSVSLVDVYGYSSFTLWTCGCNLKCPFCHNWRIAENDPELCREVEIQKIIEEIEASKVLVDYVHVTGGEPLVQVEAISELYRETGPIGIKRSLNSNLTLPRSLEQILVKDLLEHVATDLKIPPEELYGLEYQLAITKWQSFLESLSLLRDHGVQLELRIPLSKKLTLQSLEYYLDKIVKVLDIEKTLILLNPLLGEPFVKPRNSAWCRSYCGVTGEEISSYIETFKQRGFKKIAVRSVPGFQK